MAISEAAYLRAMWARSECPNCHATISEGRRVGTGKKADGGFCGLGCYTQYYAMELLEKARLLEERGKSLPDDGC
jgi:hypothetical protein